MGEGERKEWERDYIERRTPPPPPPTHPHINKNPIIVQFQDTEDKEKIPQAAKKKR